MTSKKHYEDVMRYIDDEMDSDERRRFELHLNDCIYCSNLLRNFIEINKVINSVKIAKLPEAVCDYYWNRIGNKIN